MDASRTEAVQDEPSELLGLYRFMETCLGPGVSADKVAGGLVRQRPMDQASGAARAHPRARVRSSLDLAAGVQLVFEARLVP